MDLTEQFVDPPPFFKHNRNTNKQKTSRILDSTSASTELHTVPPSAPPGPPGPSGAVHVERDVTGGIVGDPLME